MKPNSLKMQDSGRQHHRRPGQRAAAWFLMLLLLAFGTAAASEVLLPASLQTMNTHEHPDEETSVYCEVWTLGVIHHCIHSTTILGFFHRGDSIVGNGPAETPTGRRASAVPLRTPSLYFLRAPPAPSEPFPFPS